MPFGKYNLKSPGVGSSLGKARARYHRLCGEVTIVQKANPEKLKAYRAKQKRENQRRKSNGI
jgi:hypothetical protein